MKKKICLEVLKFIGLWLLISLVSMIIAYFIKWAWFGTLATILTPVILGIKFILDGSVVKKMDETDELDKLPSFDFNLESVTLDKEETKGNIKGTIKEVDVSKDLSNEDNKSIETLKKEIQEAKNNLQEINSKAEEYGKYLDKLSILKNNVTNVIQDKKDQIYKLL